IPTNHRFLKIRIMEIIAHDYRWWCRGWGCGLSTEDPQGGNLPFGPEYSPRLAFPFRTPTQPKLSKKPGCGKTESVLTRYFN
ncbi:MAG TPA: hypothetical protein PKC42_04485, partial [Candidatus Nanoperiomorbaceae bacterium]|nr:hypothetical protein [Candidatus Nanoperiomorbaceae bacterium]